MDRDDSTGDEEYIVSEGDDSDEEGEYEYEEGDSGDSDDSDDSDEHKIEKDPIVIENEKKNRLMAAFSDNINTLQIEIDDTKDEMEDLSGKITKELDEKDWQRYTLLRKDQEITDTDFDVRASDECIKWAKKYRKLNKMLLLREEKMNLLRDEKIVRKRKFIVAELTETEFVEELRGIFKEEEQFAGNGRFEEYKSGVRRRSVFNRWMIYRMMQAANDDRQVRGSYIDDDKPWSYKFRRMLAKRDRIEGLYNSYFKSSDQDDYNIDMYVVQEIIMELPEFDELFENGDMMSRVLDAMHELLYYKALSVNESHDLIDAHIKDKSSLGLIDNIDREEFPENDDNIDEDSYVFGSSDDEFPDEDEDEDMGSKYVRSYEGNDDKVIRKQRNAQAKYMLTQILKGGNRIDPPTEKKEVDKWKKKYFDAKKTYEHANRVAISDRRSVLMGMKLPPFPGDDPDAVYKTRDEKIAELAEEKKRNKNKKKNEPIEEYESALPEEEEEDVDMLVEFSIEMPSYDKYLKIAQDTTRRANDMLLQLRAEHVKTRGVQSTFIDDSEATPPGTPTSGSPKTPPKKPKKKPKEKPKRTSPWKSPKKTTPKKTIPKKSPLIVPTPTKPSPKRESENVPRKKIVVKTEVYYSSDDSDVTSSDDDAVPRIAFKFPSDLLGDDDSSQRFTSEDAKWLNNLLSDMEIEGTTTLKALRCATLLVMKLSDRLEDVYSMLKVLSDENEGIYPLTKFSRGYINDLEKDFVEGMELCTDIELQNESLYTATKIGVPMVKDFLNGLHTCCSLLMIVDEMDSDMYRVCLNSRMIFSENARFARVNSDLAKRNIHLERRQGLFEETKKKYEDMKVIETRYIEMAKLHKQREENENAIKIEKADERDEELMSRAMRKENNAVLKAWKDLRKSEVEFLVKKKKEEMEAKEKPDTKKDHMPFVFAPISAPSVSQEITRGDMWNAHVSKFSRDFITRLEHPFRELNDIINDHYAKVRRSFHAIQTVVEDIKIIRLPLMDTRCLDPPRVLLDNADFSCYNGDHRRVNFGRKGCYTILCCTNHLEELENRRGIVLLDKHYSYSDKYWNLVFETDG